ncbi:GNAT family N-acetyltransferase [Wukongibacter baidiensis]|uniref:GNAT family N-acetyltransferase n=1 Tax=Wukongibacter baidiensis TaxID=1723361 RepID=UPI003D7F5D93
MNPLSFNPFPILTTHRLTLRQLRSNDDELIFNYQNDKSNFEHVDMPIYKHITEAQKYIVRMNKGVAENKWIIWAIADKETDNILGTISIWNISIVDERGELGYGLFPGSTGKGLMTEALRKVVNYGFDTMGLKRIEAYTNETNIKSRSLLERNGFSFDSFFPEKRDTDDVPIQMVIYSKDNANGSDDK